MFGRTYVCAATTVACAVVFCDAAHAQANVNGRAIGNNIPRNAAAGTLQMVPGLSTQHARYSSAPHHGIPACNHSRAGMLASSWPTLLSPVFEVQEPIVPVYFPAPYFDSSTSAIAERERIANAERQRRTQLMEVRREAVKSRREKLKATIPEKDYTEEELAQSKFQVAHMLWQAGRINAARGQLLALLDDYPGTETAHRAKTTLARL